MTITKTACAGSSSKGDSLVTISPENENKLTVKITTKPIILKQFGKHIEKTVLKAARDEGVGSALIEVADNGALDYVIRARVRGAILRAR